MVIKLTDISLDFLSGTPKRHVYLFELPSLRKVVTKQRSRPSGLASKLPTTLSMESDFPDWIVSLEAELNRCSANPSEAELWTLLRNSVNIDLQGAILDACIIHGNYNPNLVYWFDMLSKYVFSHYKRVLALAKIRQASITEQWAIILMEHLSSLVRVDDNSTVPFSITNETLSVEFSLSEYPEYFEAAWNFLQGRGISAPVRQSQILMPISGMKVRLDKFDKLHMMKALDSVKQARCAYEEKLWICQTCTSICPVLEFKSPTANEIRKIDPSEMTTCFWKNPDQARPGYIVFANFLMDYDNHTMALVDGYSSLIALIRTVKLDPPRPTKSILHYIWKKMLYATRTVMGTVPHIFYIFIPLRYTKTGIEALFTELGRRNQIDVRFVHDISDSEYTMKRITDSIELQMRACSSGDARPEYRASILKEFENDMNYQPWLQGNVSPYERHFNVPPPRIYDRDSPQGSTAVREFLYEKESDSVASPHSGETPFPPLLQYCLIRPLSPADYLPSYWSRDRSHMDPNLFQELRDSVANYGVLLADLKVGDLVLFSNIDAEEHIIETQADPLAVMKLVLGSGASPLFMNPIPGGTRYYPTTRGTKAQTKFLKKGTPNIRPPFLAPFKVLGIKTTKRIKGLLFRIQMTGPRKVIIDNVPHACLRKCHTDIRMVFLNKEWEKPYDF